MCLRVCACVVCLFVFVCVRGKVVWRVVCGVEWTGVEWGRMGEEKRRRLWLWL